MDKATVIQALDTRINEILSYLDRIEIHIRKDEEENTINYNVSDKEILFSLNSYEFMLTYPGVNYQLDFNGCLTWDDDELLPGDEEDPLFLSVEDSKALYHHVLTSFKDITYVIFNLWTKST